MSEIRSCLVCGSKYKYCGHCNKNNIVERWKNTYCSKECRELFNTCSNFEGGLITGKEAYKIITGLNINLNNVTKAVKGSVDKILTYKPQPKQTTDESVRKPRKRRTKKVEE